MESVRTRIESLGSRIADQFSRDKKKFVVLGSAVIVCLALLAKQMISSEVPEKAVAADIVQPTETKRPVRTFARQSDRRKAAPHRYVQPKRREITRDLFSANMDAFPPLSGGEKPNRITSGTSYSAKGGSDMQRRLMHAQAKSLLLQSTMVSVNPVAIINGRMLRIGEWINGFELTEVTPRGCSVRKNGMTIMLVMSN